MRAATLLLSLASALARDKCHVGEQAKYTLSHGAAVSLLAAAPAAVAWGSEGGDGLEELQTLSEVNEAVGSAPCMIMFYAEWCPHCKKMKPIYTQVAQGGVAGVKFFMVNADAYRDIGAAYGVDGYPTIKYFHGKEHSVEYDGGENLPADKLEGFTKSEHAKALAAGVVLASTKAPPAAVLQPAAVDVVDAAPTRCDSAVCDGLECPEGWQTTVNAACQCKCLKAAGTKAAKVRAKAAKMRARSRQ